MLKSRFEEYENGQRKTNDRYLGEFEETKNQDGMSKVCLNSRLAENYFVLILNSCLLILQLLFGIRSL